MARMATVFVGAILVLICSNAFTGLAIIYAKYRQGECIQGYARTLPGGRDTLGHYLTVPGEKDYS